MRLLRIISAALLAQIVCKFQPSSSAWAQLCLRVHMHITMSAVYACGSLLQRVAITINMSMYLNESIKLNTSVWFLPWGDCP